LDVTINDGGLRISAPLVGPKLTILGTTSNTTLPTNEPVQLTDAKQISTVLHHPDGTPSELSLSVAEAIRAGAQNVEVMKIAQLSGEDSAVYAIEDRWDDLYEALDILKLTDIDIVYCDAAYVDETPTGSHATYGARGGFHYLLADKLFQATQQGNTAIGVLGPRPLMRVARDETWTGAPTDRAGELFDDVPVAFVREYVDHLTEDASGAEQDHSTHTDLQNWLRGANEGTAGQVDAAYDLWAHDEDGNIATDNRGNNVDGGAYLSIVAMPARVSHPDVRLLANRLGEAGKTDMNTNGAAAYAGLITTLQPHRAPTNRQIPGLFSARVMSAGLAKELMDYRFVTAVDKSKGFVVAAGVTAAYNASRYVRSDYVNLSTVRIVHAAIDVVRTISEDFIGNPIEPQNMAAMEAAVDQGLQRMKGIGALRRYDFSILTTPDMQILGEVDLDLTLVPAFELRKINTIVSLARE
jgi:hypothetical protein